MLRKYGYRIPCTPALNMIKKLCSGAALHERAIHNKLVTEYLLLSNQKFFRNFSAELGQSEQAQT